MKKVLVEKVREEAKYFCDKHPDREAYAQLNTMCWYGSTFDLLNVEVHMCDECVGDLYKHIKENFGVDPIEDEASLIGRCPCCR